MGPGAQADLRPGAGEIALNPREPVDHISTELEFLGLLASRGDACEFQEFFKAHYVSWMPESAEALWDAFDEGCYLRSSAPARRGLRFFRPSP